jgi:hypothetical protein
LYRGVPTALTIKPFIRRFIALRVEQHQKGKGDFRTTLESLISLASRAAELFECSKPELKLAASGMKGL